MGNPKRKNLWIEAGARPAITKRRCFKKTSSERRLNAYDRNRENAAPCIGIGGGNVR